MALKKFEFEDRVINKYDYQNELKKISDEGWQIIQIDRNTQQHTKVLLQRPIMDSVIPNIMQETDKERLLIDFLHWQSMADTANTTYKEDVANYLKSINGA